MSEQLSSPEHWAVNTIINLADFHNGRAFKERDWSTEGLPIIRIEQLNDPSSDTDKFSGILLPVNHIDSGDLIFSWSATLKVVIWNSGPGALNQHLYKVVPKSEITLLLLRYILDFNMDKLAGQSQGSTMKHVTRKELTRFKVSYPKNPLEQRKITSILNSIDQAIESTQALIEKYQLIKAGLMHDLFTRGIGADGKLRPPMEAAPELYQETAIGWIPKEWELVELGKYADICSGVTLGSKQQSDQKLKVPYLRVANVQDGYLDLSEVKEILVNQKTLDALRLVKGDVLMNEGGDFDKLGRGTVWQGEIESCIHQNHVFRVRVKKELLLPNYLAFWSQSAFGKKYFVLSSKQSTNLASINSSQLHKFPIGLASIDEQEKIESRVNVINLRIDMLEAEMEKLQKQKAGLMHDLLTGKVQVKVDDTEVNHA